MFVLSLSWEMIVFNECGTDARNEMAFPYQAGAPRASTAPPRSLHLQRSSSGTQQLLIVTMMQQQAPCRYRSVSHSAAAFPDTACLRGGGAYRRLNVRTPATCPCAFYPCLGGEGLRSFFGGRQCARTSGPSHFASLFALHVLKRSVCKEFLAFVPSLSL
jgi:hypothetical protein